MGITRAVMSADAVEHTLNNAGLRGSSFPPVVRALAGPLFFLGEGTR